MKEGFFFFSALSLSLGSIQGQKKKHRENVKLLRLRHADGRGGPQVLD